MRKLSRITGVPTADFDLVAIQDHISTEIPASDGDTWDQPEVPYAPVILLITFTNQKVVTLGNMMIQKATREYTRRIESTSYEISPDGTKTDIIKGDHYTIKYGKSQAVIDGQSDITIGETTQTIHKQGRFS